MIVWMRQFLDHQGILARISLIKNIPNGGVWRGKSDRERPFAPILRLGGRTFS